MPNITIRNAYPADIDTITAIEAACFPPAEAASRRSIQERIAAFPGCFLVALLDDVVIGFINGCATNHTVIYDKLFYDTSRHIPTGKQLAVLGLDVLPDYRRQGIATRLMKQFIEVARQHGRSAVILTCKQQLVPYYQSFGYVNNGISQSTHGGAQWYAMTLTL